MPPGARLTLNTSSRTPYVCASEVIAPSVTATPMAASSGRASPARPTDRAHQNTTIPDALTPSALIPVHGFCARAAETAPSPRNPASSRSTRPSDTRRADDRQKMPARSAVRCRTSSLGMKKRSSSNSLYVAATSTTAIAPTCRTRSASLSPRLCCAGYTMVASSVEW